MTTVGETDRNIQEATSHANSTRLEAIFQHTLDAILLADDDGRYVDANPAACTLLGYTYDELLHCSVWDLTAGVSRAEGQMLWQAFLNEGKQSGEYRLRHKKGHLIEAEYRAVANIQPGVHLSVMRDVTARRQAQRALRSTAQRFRHIADTAPAMLWLSDPSGSCVFLSQGWYTFTGQTDRTGLGKGWLNAIHDDDRAQAERVFASANETREVFQMEYRLRRHDGFYRWALDVGRPLFDDAEAFHGYIGSVIDITERKEAETQLQLLNATLEQRIAKRTAQVRALASALTLAEQRERRRVSQLLHDGVQQLLYGTRIQLQLLARYSETQKPEVVQEKTEQVGAMIHEAIQMCRSLAVDMSPPVLQKESLEAALQWLVSQMNETYGLQVELSMDDACNIPGRESRILAYQLVRELLFNVVKHARVDRAHVRGWRQEAVLFLRVEDEGVGFDIEQAEAEHAVDGGFGLFSVRERLGLFGGRIEIETAPKAGTCVTLILPLSSTASYRTAVSE